MIDTSGLKWTDRETYGQPSLYGGMTTPYGGYGDPSAFAPPTGTTPEAVGFTPQPTQTWGGVKEPFEWTKASNALQNITNSGGDIMARPEQWGTATGTLNTLSNTGGVDWTDWYKKRQASAEDEIKNQIDQGREQAGLAGMRWSTPWARQAAQIGGEQQRLLETEYAQQKANALQNAMNTRLSAATGLTDIGSQISGNYNTAKQRQLEATGQLAGLGGQMVQYPMDVAKQAFGQGTALQQTEQSELDKQYEDWLRTTEEASPWLQLATSLTNRTGVPATYGQSTAGSLASGLGSIASILPLLFQ